MSITKRLQVRVAVYKKFNGSKDINLIELALFTYLSTLQILALKYKRGSVSHFGFFALLRSLFILPNQILNSVKINLKQRFALNLDSKAPPFWVYYINIK